MHCLNKSIGNYGEDLAEEYLKSLGYKIINRNYRCKIGEIDIIGLDDNTLCFIEVKSRYENTYGTPAEAVNRPKQYKLLKTAEFYILNKKFFDYNFRFDVVEVILNNNNNDYIIKVIRNAFQF